MPSLSLIQLLTLIIPVRWQEHAIFRLKQELWMVGSMSSVAVVKFFLMLYCRTFKNEIVRAYAQDHFFDVITNSVGLVAALLAVRFKWWMDPVGAILVSEIPLQISVSLGDP